MVLGAGKAAVLFATCVNDTMFPGTPIAVVRVLGRLGCKMVSPKEQACCGQMLTNTGYFREVMPTVKSHVWAFEDYNYVVGPFRSCIGAVRHQYPMLTEYVRDKSLKAASKKLVKRAYDFTEFLVDVLGLTDVGAYFPYRVTYRLICHSVHVAHVGDRLHKLLRAVQGIDPAPLPDLDQCCGFGGIFYVKSSDVSVAMSADKVHSIMSTGAEYSVAGDNAYLIHIGGITHRINMGVRIIYLAEILAHIEEAAT